MRQLSIILGLILASHFAPGQDNPGYKVGRGFNSVFQKLVSGEFSGTVNGLLIIQNVNNVETILDFQGSNSKLIIKADTLEIYDVSAKIYKGKTTSGKTEIEYRTYAAANAFSVKLNDDWFELSLIDGACIAVIDGLDYEYKTVNDTEYLILQVSKVFPLSNWNYLRRNEPDKSVENLKSLKKTEKRIKIMPNSVLVFAIKRMQ